VHICEFCEDEIPIDKYKQHLLECFDNMNSNGLFESCEGHYSLDRFIELIDEYHGAETAFKAYTCSSFYTPYTPIWIRSLSNPVLKILKNKSESYNQVCSVLRRLIWHHAYMFKPGGYEPFFEFLEQITQEEGIWDLIKTTLNGFIEESKTEFSRELLRSLKHETKSMKDFYKKLLLHLNGSNFFKKIRFFKTLIWIPDDFDK